MRRFSFLQRAALAGVLFFAFSGIAHADTLGQRTTFFVNSGYDAEGETEVSATLRAIGQRGYFYVDDRLWSDLDATQRNQYLTNLQELSGQFDTAIYPRETALWGSEPNPGVDGDSRVTVLLEQLRTGSGGYFETVHGYARSLASESNQREMVFVNADSVRTGNARNLLAHEFQHLTSFNQKELLRDTHDDVWLNESRSEYSITYVGYSDPYEGSSLQRRVQSFLRTPSDSLTTWPNTATDYAIASVFAHYLDDRYGPDIFASSLRLSSIGAQSIDEWLATRGKTERFGDVFADWMVAAYLNDRSVGAQYGYVRPGLTALRVAPREVSLSLTAAHTTTVTLGEWQPHWLEFDMPAGTLPPVLSVAVTGQAGNPWNGSFVATYADGRRVVRPWTASDGTTTIDVQTADAGTSLRSLGFTITQGTTVPMNRHDPLTLTATVHASLGTSPVAPQPTPTSGIPVNGDLIRRPGQNEVYVVWGPYRRYLTPAILALYGFENRPVLTVSDEIFNRYTTSNYIRALNGTRVYAVWPDGTKHWLNITATQWDASGRDWNAIFVVNDAEVAYYATGVDIAR